MICTETEALKIVSDRTANYETIEDYCEKKTGEKKDYSKLVPFLVEAWRNALTIEAKDNICQSEVVEQIETPTTLTVVYKLYFQKVTVTVMKIFMAEIYDPTGKQEEISIVDDVCLIIGIEPKIEQA